MLHYWYFPQAEVEVGSWRRISIILQTYITLQKSITRSPLLHLRRWGCREMGKCIHRQSFLGRSDMFVVEEKKMQENTNNKCTQPNCRCLQTLYAYFCNSSHNVHNAKRQNIHTNTQTCLLKNTLYSGVFGRPRSSVVKLMSVVVVWAVGSLVQEHTQAAAAAADWQTDRLADRPPRRVSALLKPRDRNPTAFCMWHGRLECVWVPCWHSSLSHCYNPGGAGSKHTS